MLHNYFIVNLVIYIYLLKVISPFQAAMVSCVYCLEQQAMCLSGDVRRVGLYYIVTPTKKLVPRKAYGSLRRKFQFLFPISSAHHRVFKNSN